MMVLAASSWLSCFTGEISFLFLPLFFIIGICSLVSREDSGVSGSRGSLISSSVGSSVLSTEGTSSASITGK